MRVLVCGSRTYDGRHNGHDHVLFALLAGLAEEELAMFDELTVIEGGAPGADAQASCFAGSRCALNPGSFHTTVKHVKHEQYPADWDKYGKAAGPIRNQRMLDEGKPDLVLAFVDKPVEHSRGTYDMVGRAVQAGVPTYVIHKMA